MKTTDKSKRRIPREVVTYPNLEAYVEAKRQLALKQLAGIEKSGFIDVKE